MNIVADHLAMPLPRVLCYNQCILLIKRKHLPKWTSRLQCCHFLYMGLFSLIFAFKLLYLNVCIVCSDCPAV